MEDLKIYGEQTPPLYNASIHQPVPTITPYFLKDAEDTACVLECAGGGDCVRAEYEAGVVAEFFHECGFHAAVLNYRVNPYRYPAALLDAQRAIRFLRCHAKEFGIAANKIAILGFSAGGHLAGSCTLLEEEAPFHDEVDSYSGRPDACILCYPVIWMEGEYHHSGSRRALLGKNPEDEVLHKQNLTLQVTDDTPPCFIWHCADDETVPVQNSLQFAQALSQHKVPYALHIFPKGGHGSGLADGIFGTESWKDLCSGWLFEQFTDESYFIED